MDVLAADADVTLPHGDPTMVAILACAFVFEVIDEGRRAQVSVESCNLDGPIFANTPTFLRFSPGERGALALFHKHVCFVLLLRQYKMR